MYQTFKQFLTEKEDNRFKIINFPGKMGEKSGPEEQERNRIFDQMWDACSDMITLGKTTHDYIFRGGDFNEDEVNVAIGNPTVSERRSANTLNYYTYLIDNAEAWKNFPPRSRSFICASSESIAAGFGATYVFFPFNGSKIAACDSQDLWTSFDSDSIGCGNLDGVNGAINKILRELLGNKNTYDTSLKSFLDALTHIDKLHSKLGAEQFIATLMKNKSFDFSGMRTFINFVSSGISQHGSLRKTLELFLDPEINEISLFDTKNYNAFKFREVWTDGKCYVLNPELIPLANAYWFK